MVDALLLVLALLAAVGGMGLFALSFEAHWRPALAPRPFPSAHRFSLRRAGVALLLGALVACHLADHPSLAWLVWFMLLALAQVLVALVLAFRPRSLGWLVRMWG